MMDFKQHVPFGRCPDGRRRSVHRWQGQHAGRVLSTPSTRWSMQNKQIIISADRAPGEIKDLEERIKSRLQCGLVVDLHPTDYELRLGISAVQSRSLPRPIPRSRNCAGVLEFLAHRISTNVRVLEGALTRSVRIRVARWPRNHAGTDSGLSVRRAAGFGSQGYRRGNSAQSVRALQHPPVRDDRPKARAQLCPPAPGRDVSLQSR